MKKFFEDMLGITKLKDEIVVLKRHNSKLENDIKLLKTDITVDKLQDSLHIAFMKFYATHDDLIIDNIDIHKTIDGETFPVLQLKPRFSADLSIPLKFERVCKNV